MRINGNVLLVVMALLCCTWSLGNADAISESTTAGNFEVTKLDNDTATLEPGPPTSKPKAYWYYYKNAVAARYIGKYGSPTIIVIGITGNILSLLVMLQKENRSTSFGIYLAMLAVADAGSLVTWAYRWMIQMIIIRSMHDVECKLDVGGKYLFRMCGYWLVIFLTLDRYIIVRYPLRAMDWCVSKRAWRICGGVWLFSVLYTTPYFCLGTVGRSGGCVFIRSGGGNPWATVYMFTVLFFGLVLPFVSILYMNTVIILTIRTRVKYRGKCSAHSGCSSSSSAAVTSSTGQTAIGSGDDQGQGKDVSTVVIAELEDEKDCKECAKAKKPLSAQDRGLINILLLVTTTFLVLNMPQHLRVGHEYFYQLIYNKKITQYAARKLGHQVTNNLCNVNYSINFFLYCISGNKFRNDLKKLFGCRPASPI